MNGLRRALAGLAAVAVVLVAGVLVIRPGSGPGVQSSPRPSGTPKAVCDLITTTEAANASTTPEWGATAAAIGTAPVTTCVYMSGNPALGIILKVTLTSPGGRTAYDLLHLTSGQAVTGLADAAVFDPTTATLYVVKGDALVAIVAGSSDQTLADRLLNEEAIGRLATDRL